jgi:hypothetical protein
VSRSDNVAGGCGKARKSRANGVNEDSSWESRIKEKRSKDNSFMKLEVELGGDGSKGRCSEGNSVCCCSDLFVFFLQGFSRIDCLRQQPQIFSWVPKHLHII